MSEQKPVKIEKREDVAIILIDNPPVNAASQAVRSGLLESMREASLDPAVKAMVIACEGRTFIAGADIKEFGMPAAPPALPDVVSAVEGCSKPIVAALHGTALGGGFELAIAAHARIIASDGSVGLPEVKLGIIPGAGGTQRLPRLTGLLTALELVTSGRIVPAPEALSLGLVDAIALGDLRAEAIAMARGLIRQKLRRTGDLPVPDHDRMAVESATARIADRSRGQISPVKATEAVLLSAQLPFEEGLRRERAIFLELVASAQAKALRYAFFAEREVLRVPHLSGIAPRPITKVGVIGAGTMGSGIAIALLDAGFEVLIIETSPATIAAGRERLGAIYERQLRSSKLTPEQRDERLARVQIADELAGVKDCDFVIEAIVEEMTAKRVLFQRLAEVAKPSAVLATNTSYLDVEMIAEASGRAVDVVGLHFFSPAHVMRLVEVVECTRSAPDATSSALALGRRLGKIPVVCRVCEGFVGNRILAAYRQQAEFAVEDGAHPHEVDAALEAFGFAMGPFAVADLAGLDIGWARRKATGHLRDDRQRYASTIADRLCELGRFGQKTGAGWYSYKGGKRAIDPTVTAIVESVSAQRNIRRRPVNPEIIATRVRAVIVNEGAKILAEGIVPRSLDIDIVMMLGYGYPRWRGGPMFEADEIGLDGILDDMRSVSAASGPGWDPAPLLVKLAQAGSHFKEFSMMQGGIEPTRNE